MKPLAVGGSVGLPTPMSDLAAYRPLLRYLERRFADNVVLTFGQIEDLIGFSLPYLAYVETQWWTASEDPPTAQSATWTSASRTAVPNLRARTVAFERA
jgi:hypothetical protein